MSIKYQILNNDICSMWSDVRGIYRVTDGSQMVFKKKSTR